MASRILDPDRFLLAGAVVDWTLVARRHGKNVGDIVEKRKIGPAVVQLRWILDPKLGLPSQASRSGSASTTPPAPPPSRRRTCNPIPACLAGAPMAGTCR
jgi:hypothetical protein